MGIIQLLEYINTLPKEEQEKVLDEEYRHQKAYTDALCNLKREETKQ